MKKYWAKIAKDLKKIRIVEMHRSESVTLLKTN